MSRAAGPKSGDGPPLARRSTRTALAVGFDRRRRWRTIGPRATRRGLHSRSKSYAKQVSLEHQKVSQQAATARRPRDRRRDGVLCIAHIKRRRERRGRVTPRERATGGKRGAPDLARGLGVKAAAGSRPR